jgi:hypothetical protein
MLMLGVRLLFSTIYMGISFSFGVTYLEKSCGLYTLCASISWFTDFVSTRLSNKSIKY